MIIRKMFTFIGMEFRSNLQQITLLATYVVIALIVSSVGSVIGGKSVFGPYVNGSEPVDAQELSTYMQLFQYSLMVLLTGVCYNVLFGVPMEKAKSNGSIETMLAAPVSPKEVWGAKSIALFLPALIVGCLFTIITTAIMKSNYFPGDMTYQLNGWLLVTTFIIVPFVFISLSFLMNMIALRFNVGGSLAISNMFTPVYTTAAIILSARPSFDPNSGLFLTMNLILGLAILLVCFLLKGQLHKEKIILSCKK